jgi:hypothetical protein
MQIPTSAAIGFHELSFFNVTIKQSNSAHTCPNLSFCLLMLADCVCGGPGTAHCAWGCSRDAAQHTPHQLRHGSPDGRGQVQVGASVRIATDIYGPELKQHLPL